MNGTENCSPYSALMPREENDIFSSIAALKAKALAETGNPLVLNILRELQNKNPDDIEVKRMIGDVCFSNNMFEEAAEAWIVVYLLSGSIESLQYVICSLIYTDTFDLLFREWKIQRNCKDRVLNQIIEMILHKEANVDLSALIRAKSLFCTERYDFTREEIDVARATALAERNVIFGSSEIPCEGKNWRVDVNPQLEDVPPLSNDQFYTLHHEAIRLINEGEKEDALNLLLLLYKEQSKENLLKRLLDGEKLEILYYLSRISDEFIVHYEMTANRIKSAKIRILHAVISRKGSQAILKEVINII